MKLCRHCNAQFDEEHRRCIHCGRRLRAASEEPAPAAPGVRPAERGAPDVAELHHLTDDHPAKIAPLLERLERAEIPVALVADTGERAIVGWRGSSGWAATASVYVAPEQREAAEALHREFLAELVPQLAGPGAGDAAEDVCPACREPVSPRAASCPSCGLAFPEA